MKNIVKVKNLKIGQGPPKICIPVVARELGDILEEAESLKTIDFDLVEWRADFYNRLEDLGDVEEALRKLRYILQDKPIIFTFRSIGEGGQREIAKDFYFKLNRFVIERRLADIVDIELFNDEGQVRDTVEIANKNKVFIIISNHDFEKTPPKEEIISRLRKMMELGGHIGKIAVMPKCPGDVLSLLEATNIIREKYKDRPIITISMGKEGIISRLAGGVFGSDLTFASAGKISAPGQVSSVKLREIMELLY